MGQLTIRADDDLIARVRDRAKNEGRSMNEYVTLVLEVATNPDAAPTEAERLRERLARAGLLAVDQPYRGTVPDPRELAAAGRRAAAGKPISDLVSEMRQEGG